jgi:hypothetical protein
MAAHIRDTSGGGEKYPDFLTRTNNTNMILSPAQERKMNDLDPNTQNSLHMIIDSETLDAIFASPESAIESDCDCDCAEEC